MEIIQGIENIQRPFSKPVIALGNFDGLHRGHRKIFDRVKEEAARLGGEGIIITFDPHPMKVLSPSHCPPLITPYPKKMKWIEETGIRTVLCLEFTHAFSQLTPREFVETILMKRISPQKVIVGYNYHFGQKKSGDAQTLRTLCSQAGVEVEVMGPFLLDGGAVSSSRIRELIKNGQLEDASRLLGRDYSVFGKVIEGVKRGRLLGYPTANLEMSEELYPPVGVYAVDVLWKEQVLHGVANIGKNPTFQPSRDAPPSPLSFEIHILNFNQMIYGEELQVPFRRRIRGELRFASPEELIARIRSDIDWAVRNVFQSPPVPP
jgi:riboflavin kinase/FMN adenylyltransferase